MPGHKAILMFYLGMRNLSLFMRNLSLFMRNLSLLFMRINTCCLKFPKKIQAISCLGLMAMNDKGNNKCKYDKDHEILGRQVIFR